jgi:hypothetical protein
LILALIKKVEFSESASILLPKVKTGIVDLNKNDYGLPYELSYSSKTWFPDILYIRITWIRALNWPPLIFQHILNLKKGGSMSYYDLKFNNPYPMKDPKEEALKEKKEGEEGSGKFD